MPYQASSPLAFVCLAVWNACSLVYAKQSPVRLSRDENAHWQKTEDTERCAVDLDKLDGLSPERDEEKLLRLLQPFLVQMPVREEQPRAGVNTIAAVLAVLLGVWLLVTLCACSSNPPRPAKRTRVSRPQLLHLWMGELADVFFVFPWMGAKMLVNKIIVAPILAIRSLADDLRTSQKLRLQRQLLEEGEVCITKKPKRERTSSAGSVQGAASKSKRRQAGEKNKEPQPASTASSEPLRSFGESVPTTSSRSETTESLCEKELAENLTEWHCVQRASHKGEQQGRRASRKEENMKPIPVERPTAKPQMLCRPKASPSSAAGGSKAAKAMLRLTRTSELVDTPLLSELETSLNSIETQEVLQAPAVPDTPPPKPPPPDEPPPAPVADLVPSEGSVTEPSRMHTPGRELLALLRAPPTNFSDTGCISGGTGGTPAWNAEVAPAMSTSQPSKGIAEDDVGLRLEAMVEELAGVHSFELLEDAFCKVDAAREALSKVAPVFIPGQPWKGCQRSSFED